MQSQDKKFNSNDFFCENKICCIYGCKFLKQNGSIKTRENKEITKYKCTKHKKTFTIKDMLLNNKADKPKNKGSKKVLSNKNCKEEIEMEERNYCKDKLCCIYGCTYLREGEIKLKNDGKAIQEYFCLKTYTYFIKRIRETLNREKFRYIE